MKMDLWVVSFNLSVHSTVPLQQKLFKNCFKGIEMFNPLYYKDGYLLVARHQLLPKTGVLQLLLLLAKVIKECQHNPDVVCG